MLGPSSNCQIKDELGLCVLVSPNPPDIGAKLPPRACIITNLWLDDASLSPTMELGDIKQKIDGETNEIESLFFFIHVHHPFWSFYFCCTHVSKTHRRHHQHPQPLPDTPYAVILFILVKIAVVSRTLEQDWGVEGLERPPFSISPGRSGTHSITSAPLHIGLFGPF